MHDMNEVLIRGFIINKFKPREDVLIMTVNVPSKKSNMPNYPKITFFGESAALADEFSMYANVDIVASIQTSRRIVDGVKTYSQNMVGKSICETKRTLEAAFDDNFGGIYLSPENEVKLKGSLRQLFLISDNVLSITIETFINQRHSFVRGFIYGVKAKKYLENLTVGAPVVALGEIQTLKKAKNGKTLYFENVVINEIKTV